MLKYYILRPDHTVVTAINFEEWVRWYETADRRVALTEAKPRVWVSTVFLGLDHSWMGGPPKIFETMVWRDLPESEQKDGYLGKIKVEWLDYQERCSTWEQAEAQHADAIARVSLKQGLSGRFVALADELDDS